jgi:hypothetical protein
VLHVRGKEGFMAKRFVWALALASAVLAPSSGVTQISFERTGAYLGMGDSVAAGTGALPVTNGYAYQLYERGVFGRIQQMHFANSSARGARSWDLRDHQVPQAVCSVSAQRPTVVTITAGANDFFAGDQDIFGITLRVVQAIDLLLNNGGGIVPIAVLDPFTGQPCPPLANVTILVSNYYHIPHPVPAVQAQLDAALQGFDFLLRTLLPGVPVPAGSRVALVDLYTPSLGRRGLVTIERRLGFSGPLDFDVHPTNLGHTFIAREFERAWRELP